MNKISAVSARSAMEESCITEATVGRKLCALRKQRHLSLRNLATRSGLNVNTLNLIEKEKSSPSVSTLQQLAQALEVPITAFFEAHPIQKKVVFTPADQRPPATFGSTKTEHLGKDLPGNAVLPYIVTLEPGVGSGEQMTVHTGYEFVFCLAGEVCFLIEDQTYTLKQGDALVFESHLPHWWENRSSHKAQILLILFPTDQREDPASRHFIHEYTRKELNMKIAVITDDGKTISRHFGRAPYYLVLNIEEGAVTSREMRDKMGHSHFATQAHQEEEHGPGHGMDAASHNKHVSMAEVIADCKALICGGMGMGAYESMRQLNIQPIVTEQVDIESAVQDYIDGKLVDQTDLLH